MRDAGVGGDFLKPDRVGSSSTQTTLGCLEDRGASLRGASTPSGRSATAHGLSR